MRKLLFGVFLCVLSLFSKAQDTVSVPVVPDTVSLASGVSYVYSSLFDGTSPADSLMPWPQRVKSRLDSLMSDELLSTSQLGMCVYDITADSLLSAGHERILAIGDFNDELWPPDGAGTLKYNGRWEKIDGFFSFGDFEIREEVFVHPLLLTEDKVFGGMKPRRCFVGPRYEGGVSDHLPIILEILL